jgi:2-C-methyl-D-erythritol 4-phosphate cytidylyltransferase
MGSDALSPIYERTWVIVVAAGDGSRFGSRKQFAVVNGRPLVSLSMTTARSVAAGLVLVVPPAPSAQDLTAFDTNLAAMADTVVPGGVTRADSVRSGLRAVPADAEVVVVHDAARPLASRELFERVVSAVIDGADAAIPAIAVTDTLKRVDRDVVVQTVDRDGLVAVQTPQAFRASLLREAHATGATATDDAALVEALGATVRIVPGESTNLKLTSSGDLRVIESLIQD